VSAATPCTGGRPLGDHLQFVIGKIVELLPGVPDDVDSPAADVLRKLKSGELSPDELDSALLPLAAESVASDQPIEFVRIAGDVASPASVAFHALAKERQPKIAGLQLHHLGAFFDRDWRTNDWWWGRLDSVRALLDVVLDAEALQALRASGYLTKQGFTQTSDSVDDIKLWLLKTRQLQLLNERCGPQPDFDSAVKSEAFVAWAGGDRRLSSLLGTRSLTSTAIRGVITASKVVRQGTSKVAGAALTVSRPVLLAVAGVALAGRRAAAAVAWTMCLMMAVRANSAGDRWVIWVVGTCLSAAIAALVEVKFKPARSSPLQWWPYVYAFAGVAAGALAIAKYDSLQTSRFAAHGWNLWWMIPPLAAGASAVMLFFWMRWWASTALTALTAFVYFVFAHAAFRVHDHDPVAWWPRPWMFHSLWVCWVLAILGIPIIIGFMPDSMLRPSTSTSGPNDNVDTNAQDDTVDA
jgi:Protein of unknown function (DUF3376)